MAPFLRIFYLVLTMLLSSVVFSALQTFEFHPSVLESVLAIGSEQVSIAVMAACVARMI